MTTKSEKYELLQERYFGNHGLNLIWNNLPNIKELANNVVWRVASIEIPAEFCLPELGKDPFQKEFLFNGVNVLSAITSTKLSIPIGSSNTTYSKDHLLYAIYRAGGKLALVAGSYGAKAIFPSLPENFVKHTSTASNFIVDPYLRNIPLRNELLQKNSTADVNSQEFNVIALTGGVIRTIGSWIGAEITRTSISPFVQKNIIFPLGSIILQKDQQKLADEYGAKNSNPLKRIVDSSKEGVFPFVKTVIYEVGAKVALQVTNAPFFMIPSRGTGGVFEDFAVHYITPDDEKTIEGGDNSVSKNSIDSERSSKIVGSENRAIEVVGKDSSEIINLDHNEL